VRISNGTLPCHEVGIPEAMMEQAFGGGTGCDPDAAGSGLGLAIARGLCEALGIERTHANGARGLVATRHHTVRFRKNPSARMQQGNGG
jgi:hypothetical protein